MALIRIDGGTTKLQNGFYQYAVHDSAGFHLYTFAASQTPILGDEIDTSSGVLVPRIKVAANDNPLSPSWPEPIVNNDPGFQNKRKNGDVWPHGTVDVGKKESF
jgi:hypothetical protein